MCIVPFKIGNIRAFWNRDSDGVLLARVHVVAVEVSTQPAGFKTNDRIGLWIEGVVASKDGQGNRVALQTLGPAGERLVDNETKKCTTPFARLEMRARENALQLDRHIRRQDLRRFTTGYIGRSISWSRRQGRITHQAGELMATPERRVSKSRLQRISEFRRASSASQNEILLSYQRAQSDATRTTSLCYFLPAGILAQTACSASSSGLGREQMRLAALVRLAAIRRVRRKCHDRRETPAWQDSHSQSRSMCIKNIRRLLCARA